LKICKYIQRDERRRLWRRGFEVLVNMFNDRRKAQVFIEVWRRGVQDLLKIFNGCRKWKMKG
jgi:hypothetical protein